MGQRQFPRKRAGLVEIQPGGRGQPEGISGNFGEQPKALGDRLWYFLNPNFGRLIGPVSGPEFPNSNFGGFPFTRAKRKNFRPWFHFFFFHRGLFFLSTGAPPGIFFGDFPLGFFLPPPFFPELGVFPPGIFPRGNRNLLGPGKRPRDPGGLGLGHLGFPFPPFGPLFGGNPGFQPPRWGIFKRKKFSKPGVFRTGLGKGIGKFLSPGVRTREMRSGPGFFLKRGPVAAKKLVPWGSPFGGTGVLWEQILRGSIFALGPPSIYSPGDPFFGSPPLFFFWKHPWVFYQPPAFLGVSPRGGILPGAVYISCVSLKQGGTPGGIPEGRSFPLVGGPPLHGARLLLF